MCSLDIDSCAGVRKATSLDKPGLEQDNPALFKDMQGAHHLILNSSRQDYATDKELENRDCHSAFPTMQAYADALGATLHKLLMADFDYQYWFQASAAWSKAIAPNADQLEHAHADKDPYKVQTVLMQLHYMAQQYPDCLLYTSDAADE